MTEALDYELTNVGPHEHTRLTFYPGANEIVGANGSGKTEGMKAVMRAHGAEVPVERRDGTTGGTIRGPGDLLVKIGKVIRRTGTAPVHMVDLYPVSQLIDPGIADPDAANRALIRALAVILDLKIDESALAVLCEDDDLREWLATTCRTEAIEDLIAAAEKLRLECHRRARAAEAEAEAASGRSAAAIDAIARARAALGGPPIDTTPEVARTLLVENARSYERAEAQARARAKLEAQQQQIRETLGDRPDASVAIADLQARQAEARSAEDEVQALTEKLAAARERRVEAQEAERAAATRATELAQAAARWDEAQKVLEQPLEGPTLDDLPALRVRHVDEPAKLLETAQRSADVRSAETHREAAERSKREASEDALRYRARATSVTERVGRVLASKGAEGITLLEGRLAAVDEKGTRDWLTRLSEGERTAKSMVLAFANYPPECLIPIEARVWTTLDPANCRMIDRMAREASRYVVAERPADGPLRVERVNSTDSAA